MNKKQKVKSVNISNKDVDNIKNILENRHELLSHLYDAFEISRTFNDLEPILNSISNNSDNNFILSSYNSVNFHIQVICHHYRCLEEAMSHLTSLIEDDLKIKINNDDDFSNN